MSFSIVPHVKYKSPSMLPQAIDQAIALHQTGSLSAAERLYLEILKRNPNHFEAQHFLGILRHQQGRNTEASDLNAARTCSHSNRGGLSVAAIAGSFCWSSSYPGAKE
jgi:hypothetical protein